MVVQAWPSGFTYWRSSAQMGQVGVGGVSRVGGKAGWALRRIDGVDGAGTCLQDHERHRGRMYLRRAMG